jgi:general secretion pathway protein G
VRAAITFCLAILAVLACLLLLRAILSRLVGSHPAPIAAIAAAQADIKGGIKSTLDQFKLDTGAYPKGSNGLVELVQQPSGTTNWHGPYLKSAPIDPWGDPYIYYYPGKHNQSSYDLLSTGPDGKEGTDDDIGNWVK